jgi:FixJ family two-component response regulator
MNKQTAAEIGVSMVTVKVHRHNAMKKLGAKFIGGSGANGRPAGGYPAP